MTFLLWQSGQKCRHSGFYQRTQMLGIILGKIFDYFFNSFRRFLSNTGLNFINELLRCFHYYK